MSGVAAGCREIGCALIGGEIAELSELYTMGEYDLAGTIVGVVEESQLITGSQDCAGGWLGWLGFTRSCTQTAFHLLGESCLRFVAMK